MNNHRIFVVGGAGFLGYHVCLELVRRGYDVTSLAIPNETAGDYLTSGVTILQADIDQTSDEALGDMLKGHDALVYAVGPDDRIELESGVKARDFFQKHLVDRTERVLKIAKQSGVEKAIIFGSYFSYISNHGLAGVPVGQLERHPYIEARVDQTKRGFALGDDGFAVAVLNIPYVFGVAPGKTPIWRHVFLERFKDFPKIYYGNGGTTVVSAKKIAVATAQAIEFAAHGDELAVGSKNMKFHPMIEQLLREAGIGKPVGYLPNWLLSLGMKRQYEKAKKAGLDAGLDLRYLTDDILKRDLYVDFAATDERLHMTDFVDDIDAAIRETGEAMRQ